MKNRCLLPLSLITLGALLLSACSPQATPTAAPASTTAPTQPSAPTAAPAQPDIKGQTIEVLLPSWAQLPDDMLAAFEKESGVKVNLTIADWDKIRDKVSIAGAAGSKLADVAEFDWSWTGQFSKAGWFIPLEDKLPKDLTSDLVNAAPFTADGHLYAVPYSNDYRISVYNTDMFNRAGITTPPATFDELMEVAQKIHTPEVAAFVSRGNPASPHLSYVWSNYCLGFGGRFFKNPPENLTPVLNSPQAIKAAEFYATLMTKYGVPGSTNYAIDEAVQAMQQGKAAMTIDSIDVLSPIMVKEKSLVADKVKVAMIPKGPGGQFPMVVFHGFMIPKGSPNKEAAWLFIQWATSKDRMTKIATQSDGLGARDSVYSSAPIQKRFMWNGVDAGALMNQVQALAAKENYMNFRQVTFFQAVGDRVGVAIQEIMTGKRSAKESMEACNADLVNIVKRAGGKINEADLIKN